MGYVSLTWEANGGAGVEEFAVVLQPVGGRVKPLLGADRFQHLRGKVKQYIINTVGGSKPFLVHTLLQHLRGVISLIITVLPHYRYLSLWQLNVHCAVKRGFSLKRHIWLIYILAGASQKFYFMYSLIEQSLACMMAMLGVVATFWRWPLGQSTVTLDILC